MRSILVGVNKAYESFLFSCTKQNTYPEQINSARGEGYFAAVNGRDAAHRDKLVGGLRRKGRRHKLASFQRICAALG